ERRPCRVVVIPKPRGTTVPNGPESTALPASSDNQKIEIIQLYIEISSPKLSRMVRKSPFLGPLSGAARTSNQGEGVVIDDRGDVALGHRHHPRPGLHHRRRHHPEESVQRVRTIAAPGVVEVDPRTAARREMDEVVPQQRLLVHATIRDRQGAG